MQRELEEAKETSEKYLGAQQLLESLVEQGVLQQLPDGSVKPTFSQVDADQPHEQLLE